MPKASDFAEIIAGKDGHICALLLREPIAQPCKCFGANDMPARSGRRAFDASFVDILSRNLRSFFIRAAALNRAVLPGWAEEDAPYVMQFDDWISGWGCSRVVCGLRRALQSVPRNI